MPTPQGGETIGERLTRLRSELVDARLVVRRASRNGQSFSVNGTAITEISIERAQERVDRLEAQIRTLESRLAGGSRPRGMAHTRTSIDS